MTLFLLSFETHPVNIISNWSPTCEIITRWIELEEQSLCQKFSSQHILGPDAVITHNSAISGSRITSDCAQFASHQTSRTAAPATLNQRWQYNLVMLLLHSSSRFPCQLSEVQVSASSFPRLIVSILDKICQICHQFRCKHWFCQCWNTQNTC